MTWPLAQGHNAGPKTKATVIRPPANNTATWPAGSMFSSVNELARFVIAFLNGGKLDGAQALPPALIAELSKPRVAYPGHPDRHYALGLSLASYRGVPVIEHGGSRSGYGSHIRMAPAHKVGIITVTNVSGQSLARAGAAAAALLLPLGPEEKTSNAASPIAPADAAPYVGVYVNGAVRTELVLRDGALVARTGSRQTPVRKAKDGWLLIGDNRVFAVMEKGRVAYLHSGSRSLARQ